MFYYTQHLGVCPHNIRKLWILMWWIYNKWKGKLSLRLLSYHKTKWKNTSPPTISNSTVNKSLSRFSKDLSMSYKKTFQFSFRLEVLAHCTNAKMCTIKIFALFSLKWFVQTILSAAHCFSHNDEKLSANATAKDVKIVVSIGFVKKIIMFKNNYESHLHKSAIMSRIIKVTHN